MLIMELQQGNLGARVSGRQRESEAEKMLKAELELTGAHDFAARLPRLLYNHLTGGGVYRSRNLRIFPGNWNGMGDVPEHGGLIYMGHHLTFRSSEDETAILTYADPFRSPLIPFPNRENLAGWLADPASCVGSFLKEPGASIFANGVIIKERTLAVNLPSAAVDSEEPINSYFDVGGPVRPVFNAYMHHVGRPLIRVLGGR